MFIGDLGNEVNDQVLANAFIKYPSFAKAKVIRNKITGKTKGYGFVSVTDVNDYIKIMREMNGKYVGNRPIKIKRSNFLDIASLLLLWLCCSSPLLLIPKKLPIKTKGDEQHNQRISKEKISKKFTLADEPSIDNKILTNEYPINKIPGKKKAVNIEFFNQSFPPKSL